MRRLWVGLQIVAIAAVAGSPATARAEDVDHVTALIGTWACESEAQSTAINHFVRNADGSIAYTIRYRNDTPQPDRRAIEGEFDGVFRFDEQLGTWHWTSTKPANATFIEEGTGSPWTATDWVVEGTEKETKLHAGSLVPVTYVREKIRMIHTYLSNSLFEREFDVERHGTWLRSSRSTCLRIPDPPPGT